MKIVTSIENAREASHGGVLIPTMGALHEGHLSLARKAISLGRPAVVSIFVNPTQFGPNEDFSRYPRDIKRDAQLLESVGVDVVFAPSVEEIYPDRNTFITVGTVTDLYEGAIRPGHFQGVATVVCKLFNICSPSVAIFGLKDLQQCAVISKMTTDLNLPVKLVFEDTRREENGLAMSSRNAYLSSQTRALAGELYRQLTISRDLILQGSASQSVLESARAVLKSHDFVVDYLDLIDLKSFHPISEIGEKCAIIGAIRTGTTRLIDNVIVN